MSIDCDKLNLQGKVAGIYGVGGSTGNAVVNFLVELGFKLILYDDKDHQKVAQNLDFQPADKNYCKFVDNKYELLTSDFIVTSPGVSLEQEFFSRTKENNVLVISEIELAYNFFERFLIAITGTNGKTTTTSLVGDILSTGLNSRNVRTAGNIGAPLLQVLDKGSREDIIVAEVSSFQLAGIKNFAPDIAVALNFSPDHLDWHKNAEAYKQSKRKIFINQTPEQIAIINGDDKDINQMAAVSSAQIKRVSGINKEAEVYVDEEIIVGKDKLISRDDVKIKGTHNFINIAFAAFIGIELGVDYRDVKKAIRNFCPPPHRMQEITRNDDLLIIDDSKATNPHAGCAALNSLKEKDNIVIIAGGQDRSLDLSSFAKKIAKNAAGAVLLGETAEILNNLLASYQFSRTKIAENMQEAVNAGMNMLEGEGVLILSPGAPSWDMFESYKQRGRLFQAEVRKHLPKLDI